MPCKKCLFCTSSTEKSKSVPRYVTLILPHDFFQLYGYCYQDSNDIPDTLTTITELGSPLEMIQLLQTSWEDRFRVSNNCSFKRTFKRVMNIQHETEVIYDAV